jgi:hypothetical protein
MSIVMRKILIVLFVSMLTFWSCSSDSGTSVTLKNLAAGSVYFNFRGEITSAPAGQTIVISDLPRGIFEYATTYAIPAGATTSSAVGDLDGEIEIKAGSKVLILYSSTLIDNSYTIYASRTSNDDLSEEGNPLFPE